MDDVDNERKQRKQFIVNFVIEKNREKIVNVGHQMINTL